VVSVEPDHRCEGGLTVGTCRAGTKAQDLRKEQSSLIGRTRRQNARDPDVWATFERKDDRMTRFVIYFVSAVTLATTLHATEFHVATGGKDSNPGTQAAPLRTIQRAADLAAAGRRGHRAWKAYTGNALTRRAAANPMRSASLIRPRRAKRLKSKAPKSSRTGQRCRTASGK